MRTIRTAVKQVVLDAAARVSGHPSLKWLASNLRFRTTGDLAALAERYGISIDVLEDALRSGLDNPAYRFHRDGAFFRWFLDHQEELRGCSWLDVGADTGVVSLYLSDLLASDDYEMCDVKVAEHHQGSIHEFEGTHLDHADAGFDLVLFSYVLHHAGDDTLQLLRDARRIARRYVIVSEDPKETVQDYVWAYKHDKAGTFRGLKEWRELFRVLGLQITYETPLSKEIHSRHFFVLTPWSDWDAGSLSLDLSRDRGSSSC